jgi:adenosylhomocysteine nucleosidase
MSALAGELTLLGDEMESVDAVDADGFEFRLGRVGERPVVVAASGIGKVNAAMVAMLAIDRFRPTVVLFTGVAGGLDETLRIGDIVVGERVVHHDTGILEPDGLHLYQSGHVPFVNPTDDLGFAPSPELLAAARRIIPDVELSPVLGRQPDVVFGTIATCDQFIHSEADRIRLHDMVGAAAVEMEGAAVAQVADHFGVDHLVIRAVSDLAGKESVVDFTRFLGEAAANSVRIVTALLQEL